MLPSSQSVDAVKDKIDQVFNLQIQNKQKLRHTTAVERIAKLQRIKKWILTHREDIRQSIYADFKKPPIETDISEVFVLTSEIKLISRKLNKWLKPEKVTPTLAMITTKSWIQYEPKGTVLIISPWNYPFMLAIEPLISAIAAGNSIILKPSEISSNTSHLIKNMIDELFEESEVKVFEGGKEISSHLLTKPFDHIFFTGSTKVGKIVMKAAAENLTSVTLELGGKSPVIIDDTADLKDASGKIAWSKFFNTGQSCQAPDYILIHESKKEEFISLLKNEIKKFCGTMDDNCLTSKSFSRIINEGNVNRLNYLLEDAKINGAKVEFGGKVKKEDDFIFPTILSGPLENSKIMKEEIFGPILPVLTFSKLQNAFSIVNSNGAPLAVYIFSKNKNAIEEILQNTSSGGSCINDLFIQFSHLNLPFGGVGNSGMGKAHGFYGFKTFSNERSILKSHKYSPLKLLFPPYTKTTQKLVDLIIKYF